MIPFLGKTMKKQSKRRKAKNSFVKVVALAILITMLGGTMLSYLNFMSESNNTTIDFGDNTELEEAYYESVE